MFNSITLIENTQYLKVGVNYKQSKTILEPLIVHILTVQNT